jgi:hypothetical protein
VLPHSRPRPARPDGRLRPAKFHSKPGSRWGKLLLGYMELLEWYIPLGLLAALLLLMLRKRAYKECPWFFAYVAFAVAAGLARFLVRNHPHVYRSTYWITEAGYGVLGILVMYELLLRVLRDRVRTRRGRLIFPAALLVGIVLSLAHAHSVPPRFGGLLFYSIVAEIAVRYVQVLIFVVLGVLAARALFFGLRWPRYSLGIALGFGLYSSVALLIGTRFLDIGPSFRFLFNLTSFVAYAVAVLIWMVFFIVPEVPEPPPVPDHEASALDAPNRLRRVRGPWARRLRLE